MENLHSHHDFCLGAMVDGGGGVGRWGGMGNQILQKASMLDVRNLASLNLLSKFLARKITVEASWARAARYPRNP